MAWYLLCYFFSPEGVNTVIHSEKSDWRCFLFQDMIRVVESKSAKKYGDYFLRQIVKVIIV